MTSRFIGRPPNLRVFLLFFFFLQFIPSQTDRIYKLESRQEGEIKQDTEVILIKRGTIEELGPLDFTRRCQLVVTEMRFKQIDDDSSKFFPQRKERDLSRGEKVTWELRKKKKKYKTWKTTWRKL